MVFSTGRRALELGFLVVLFSSIGVVESKCKRECVALASYYVWQDSNLTFIGELMGYKDPFEEILQYNRPQVPNKDSVKAFTRIKVPFSCDCIKGEFLGHEFNYSVKPQDTYEKVAETWFSNLTTADWLQKNNRYPAINIPDVNAWLNVTVNCSCGNEDVSKDYGLFVTYPLRPGNSLASIATEFNLTVPQTQLLQQYNPGSNFSSGSGLVYIPGKDPSGNYPPLKLSTAGLKGGAVAGISIAGVAAAIFLAVCVYIGLSRRKKSLLLPLATQDNSTRNGYGSEGILLKTSESVVQYGAAPMHAGVAVDKSVEFSLEELAKATDDFSLANKIGQGGFGAVYYAELRGEKAAIKKMDMKASKEFLAELKVLTHVHHLNLVRLIGYCVEGSLFLVYEFIESGNLSEHLRGSGKEPLSWSTRVQIALDSARGLEYIHEHTVPVYIHRDIKSQNILIDKNYRGKVADFGLAKLTEVGGVSLQTSLVGTFGYMSPEYARYGDVSPKVDVYAFGVVLYELISAKEAVVKIAGSNETRGLVSMFEDILNQPDPKEDLCKIIDPRLGDNYPLDSVRKMVQLAKACTEETPQMRPSMRSIVVALMTLSSTTEDWDVGAFHDNHGLRNLMSGR